MFLLRILFGAQDFPSAIALLHAHGLVAYLAEVLVEADDTVQPIRFQWHASGHIGHFDGKQPPHDQCLPDVGGFVAFRRWQFRFDGTPYRRLNSGRIRQRSRRLGLQGEQRRQQCGGNVEMRIVASFLWIKRETTVRPAFYPSDGIMGAWASKSNANS